MATMSGAIGHKSDGGVGDAGQEGDEASNANQTSSTVSRDEPPASDTIMKEISDSKRDTENLNPKTCTIHEHLHQQLIKLLSAAPSQKASRKDSDNVSKRNGSALENGAFTPTKIQPKSRGFQHSLNDLSPKDLYLKARDEGRRKEKVDVLNNLLYALREDQTLFHKSLAGRKCSSLNDNQEQGAKEGEEILEDYTGTDITGRIHGCVGSHWELLPPIYSTIDTRPKEKGCDQDETNDETVATDSRDARSIKSTLTDSHSKTASTARSVETSPTFDPKTKTRKKRVETSSPQPSPSLNFQGATKPGGGVDVAALSGGVSPVPANKGIPSPWSIGGRRRSWAMVGGGNGGNSENKAEEAAKALGPPPLFSNDEKKPEKNAPSTRAAKTSPSQFEPLLRGGGLRLPGLDWNKTFRKGYTIMVWVRPTLEDAWYSSSGASSTRIPEGAPPRKQVLYRLATSLHDNVIGAVGICAILGQWNAIPFSCTRKRVESAKSLNENNDNGDQNQPDKGKKRMMLTTPITVYTLPKADPMSHLYPGPDDMNNDNDPSKTKKKKEAKKINLEPPKSPKSIEFMGGGGAHARNMENFQKHQPDYNTGVSNHGRMATKAKMSKEHLFAKQMTPGEEGRKNGNRGDYNNGPASSGRETSAPSSASSGYVTGQITLPADEWSLITIQHSHPYLRRPELTISVNGEEMVKGELGYPVLDGVTPSPDEEVGNVGGLSHASIGKTGVNRWNSLNDQERKILRKRGIFAECTLLDGAFDNGVRILGSKPSSSQNDSTVVTCITSIHSLALLSGMPVPNAVVAMIAERGPLGDSSSGSAFSFVLGPVPTNPQNRDAVVALSAGHGYYGSGGTVGAGHGNGGGIVGGGGVPGELVPPRSLGIPVSVGITPGVEPSKSPENDVRESATRTNPTWIGGGEERGTHVALQELIGKATWTFHAGDTNTLGVKSSCFPSIAEEDVVPSIPQMRILCPPSRAPSLIGGADSVPKVGIVRPTIPTHMPTSAGMEVVGNSRYQNITWNYVQRENAKGSSTKISLSSEIDRKHHNFPPISFPRAVQAANAINCVILPLRLALPRAGNVEVNESQHAIHLESFYHLNDLLSNRGQLTSLIIIFIAECFLCGGSSMRDEALQTGVIHSLVNLIRKVLIRGARLGAFEMNDDENHSNSLQNRSITVRKPARHNIIKSNQPRENFDYDQDHHSSCPPTIPLAISNAMVILIDACCGSISPRLDTVRGLQSPILHDPYRGVLRVRRASDAALTALFGLAMDFDLLGNDTVAAAPILQSIAERYCQEPAAIVRDQINSFAREDYGHLLRKQMNLQYFLDTIRVRFDHSVAKASEELVHDNHSRYHDSERVKSSIYLVADALSEILYCMILATLTSSSGTSVTRGERDVGALVATLTECPLGSVCAHVVTTTIAKLLVKCRVLSPLCLGSSDAANEGVYTRRPTRSSDIEEVSLESRLGRNMILCHYHDIVAPLLLSRSVPHYSFQQNETKEGANTVEESKVKYPRQIDFVNGTGTNNPTLYIDWTHHWRLSLFTFVWLCSLAGSDGGRLASDSTGRLLLASAKAGSLEGAFLGNIANGRSSCKNDVIGALSKFLVRTSSGEKDSGSIAKKAESISSRLAMFMPLVPGISLALISPLFQTNKCSAASDSSKSLSITEARALAAGTLKELLSMLSLSIQSLYGSKKGLINPKPGAKGNVHLSHVKSIYLSAARDYVPILLHVVSMLDLPLEECRAAKASKRKSKSTLQLSSLNDDISNITIDDNLSSEVLPSTDSIQRQRTDSSDKDWVDVTAPKIEGLPGTGGETLTPTQSPHLPSDFTKNSTTKSIADSNDSAFLEQTVISELGSCQDIALYAVSRIVASAMKCGGGEASTTVWRIIISALNDFRGNSSDGKEDRYLSDVSSTDLAGNETAKDAPPEFINPFYKSTLCHLAALVLSKFARHHDQRVTNYSHWDIDRCSSVARLMDLVEEKQLLTSPQQSKRSLIITNGTDAKDNKNGSSPGKYSIDQVRLLKSLLEMMASGRESAGWAQIHPYQLSKAVNNEVQHGSNDDEEKGSTDLIGNATNSKSYELYHQGSNPSKSEVAANAKLLLPILQSCLRIVIPSMGIIRSEAAVISAAAPGKSPSTAVLLELVSTELNLSLTAAIAGLSFPVARDIFMNAVASLRRSIKRHKSTKDTKAVGLCCNLLLNIVEAMRSRYANERNRKMEMSNESGDSQVVESIILGQNLVPENTNADVLDDNNDGAISKPQELRHSSDVDFIGSVGEVRDRDQTKSNMSMGWSQYKGLGAALARCYRELNDRPSLGTRCLGPSCSNTTPEEKANLALSILECYIDNWDKVQAQDAAEAELVDLFDESINLDGTSNEPNTQGITNSSNHVSNTAALASSSLASDAMTRFIEAQSMLQHQHRYLAFEYLLTRRFGRSAFTERLCWKTWMDFIDVKFSNSLWERGVHDGGRDFYSKIVTLPMFPQFPRFIPSYLDHSPSGLSDKPSDQTIDQFNSLVRSSIKIVDITKKENTEEQLEQVESMDDGADDMFPDVLEEEEENDDGEDLEVHFPTRGRGVTHDNLSDSQRNNDGTLKEDTFEHGQESSPNCDQRGEESQRSSEIYDTPTNHLAPQEGSFHFATSSFSFPPDSNSLHSLGQGVRLGGGFMEEYYSSCLHVRPECSRKCIVMLTESHLILEYEDGDAVVEGEIESQYKKKRSTLSGVELQDHDQAKLMDDAFLPKAMRWNISEASHVYLRRYRLRDSALELFFIPSAGATTGGTALFAGSRSLFLDFGTGSWGNTRRDDAANAIMKRAPMQTVKQWPDKSGQFLHEELKKLSHAWTQGAISNFDYLLSLNCLAGRSFNDICQYPVMPWVLSNYHSEEVPDLTDKSNFRDLSKPMGALNEERLAELLERFETFADQSIPPFMYGSHYSTSAGVVIHFLLRLHPFSLLHRHLQSGHFDVADRLFSSIERTWNMCTGRSAAEVKELTPEFYSNPSFLRNSNKLKLGTMQDGEVLGDVILPPWANGSPEKFIEVMRLALESDICSEMLPDWIDLIFGRKQQGKAAIEAHNVFFYLTYYGSVDVASIEDEGLRKATELQIAHFGQCPMQLFYRRHASKKGRSNRRRRQTLSEYLRLYNMKTGSLPIHTLPLHIPKTKMLSTTTVVDNANKPLLPFTDAPLSYWVHLGAPPPGPHAPLISIRLALADRCMAVDSNGIFHFFRWAWKPEFIEEDVSDDDADSPDDSSLSGALDLFCDKGCFVAQRELFSFRNIPRLPYSPVSTGDFSYATVSVSKTLFANRSLLLILSDGDGKGGLAMQLVDPSKGLIKGEVIVPSAHADRITSIDMDPIGTASGQGGVGGELAFVGSADGTATLWRFISSHYWPLRPRVRMGGHLGATIYSVAISSTLGVCASVSAYRCCLFDVGNGAMIRNFSPPIGAGNNYAAAIMKDNDAVIQISFADTPAVCLTTLGFLVVVCCTKLRRGDELLEEIFSLELLTLEGIHIGSSLLETHRRPPKKIFSNADGRAVFVCGEGGMSIHLVSTLHPLAVVDQWRLGESDTDNNSSQNVMHDLDFGPTLSRPVLAAAGCSDGALRLHALQGIGKWSNENQRNTVSSAVGNVLALPAQTVKNALGGVAGMGSRFVGFGKEIGKEAFSVVRDREGGFFFRKNKG